MLEAENEQPGGNSRIQQQSPSKMSPPQISQQPIAKFRRTFPLSRGHYFVLLVIKDPDERSFYEIEAANEGWYDAAWIVVQ